MYCTYADIQGASTGQLCLSKSSRPRRHQHHLPVPPALCLPDTLCPLARRCHLPKQVLLVMLTYLWIVPVGFDLALFDTFCHFQYFQGTVMHVYAFLVAYLVAGPGFRVSLGSCAIVSDSVCHKLMLICICEVALWKFQILLHRYIQQFEISMQVSVCVLLHIHTSIPLNLINQCQYQCCFNRGNNHQYFIG